MRVVFDNNVLISAALLINSVPFMAFEKAVKKHVILRSSEILQELRETIYKSKFDKYFENDVAREGFVISFIAASNQTEIAHNVAICRDPKDNVYLELALSGKADCIISGDDDLLILDPFRKCRIITPKDFLDLY
jgi:uncharacterized protein